MKLYGYEMWDDFRLKFNNEFNLNLTDDVTLLGSSDLARYILTKYGSWRYICGYESVDDAYSDFLATWKQFIDLRKNDLLRLYDALNMEYNPIENYDRHEDITSSDGGTETTTSNLDELESLEVSETSSKNIDYSGGEKNTLSANRSENSNMTKSGEEIEERVKSNTVNDELEYEGSESILTTPNKTKTESVSAFNSSELSPMNGVEESGTETSDKSFNARKDVHNVTENGTDTVTKEFNNLSDTLNSTNSEESTNTKSYENRKDTISDSVEKSNSVDKNIESNSSITFGKTNTTTAHIHGNIGTMTTQSMLNEERRLRFYNLASDIVDKFMYEFTIMY